MNIKTFSVYRLFTHTSALKPQMSFDEFEKKFVEISDVIAYVHHTMTNATTDILGIKTKMLQDEEIIFNDNETSVKIIFVVHELLHESERSPYRNSRIVKYTFTTEVKNIEKISDLLYNGKDLQKFTFESESIIKTCNSSCESVIFEPWNCTGKLFSIKYRMLSKETLASILAPLHIGYKQHRFKIR